MYLNFINIDLFFKLELLCANKFKIDIFIQLLSFNLIEINFNICSVKL
jgi:hypothetical protein